ncbi:Clan CA, family C40, NlpC/P60 superfamily cysteine peptidase [Trichomonas vaginalis G3]|uniref:Clan CA, family C40, NlpC/P60 superfamily cysteine peptidase n=1 Tax=Trichomonas vaginalis (strain ATCC PRA-98 / G3) TaxID=412133 RepID=A2F134_TRIV3|nr:murein DD-endopeptidase MEPH-related family [Trichomonas vaginalis G3]EAY01385.1 Clan CA, family C40, NlpC/P60 superfamily cysteine peptidase [Trichomonas vaginalis G3]KAI5497465.1 murein DD-endopeptidase MEPH-related family [Trichomonas vaginalis G3]|eukprot:XP_001330233.1 Clan CA, family C40, NlpC/P60 superfamily cysteine peptidase [Trichomonas vaginalis G3]
MNYVLKDTVDIGDTKTKSARINLPEKKLVMAYKTSTPEDLKANCYWLYDDFFCHILGYENGYAHVRIGNESCYIDQDSIQEIIYLGKTILNADLFSEPNTTSATFASLNENTDLYIIDYNINGYIEVYYQGKTGFILQSLTDFDFKPFKGENDGEIVVKLAKTKLGCKYVWAATGPNEFDCSGLMQWCYNKLDIFIHRTSGAQGTHGTKITDEKDLLPGDLVTFATESQRPGVISHVGMFIGDGKFLHCSSALGGAVITEIKEYDWPFKTMTRYWQH